MTSAPAGRPSIRRRILRGFAALLAATVALQTAWMTAEAGRENNVHHDGEMARVAALLAGGGATAEIPPVDSEEAEEYFSANVYFVADADGQTTIHSPLAKENAATKATNWFAGAPFGFSEVAAPEPDFYAHFLERNLTRLLPPAGWRIYVLPLKNGGRAGVAQSLAWRRDILFDAAFPLLATVLLALPILAAGLALILRRGFAPLARLARDANARRADDFRPLESADAPEEVRQFTGAFNALLARIADTFRREKTFTANAAHELRTPLAAIQIHAENAAAAPDDAERRRALAELLKAARRATGTVEQLLARARAESAPDDDGRRASLAALCREAAAQFSGGDAADKIELIADEDAEVAAAAAPLILILLRNLIDNALRHGGQAQIFAKRRDDGACVSVLDDGPGFDPEFSPRLLEPFERGGAGAGDGSGCGLGLSICATAAKRIGAQMQIGNRRDGRGAAVRVFFNANQPGEIPLIKD